MEELFDEIVHDGESYFISLVAWGFIRKKGYGFFKSKNIFKNPLFTPDCEVAVFTQRPSTGKLPVVIIYIADSANGEKEFNNVVTAVRKQGLQGAMNYVIDKSCGEQEYGKIFPENL